MPRKEIKKIDMVPEWIRETVAGFNIRSVRREFNVLRPKAVGAEASKLVVSLEQDNDSGHVSVFWDGTLPEGSIKEYYLKLPWIEAEVKYNGINSKLAEIEALKVNPENAKLQLGEYLAELRPSGEASDPNPRDVGPRTNSSLIEGWDIIEKEGKLLVRFSNEFLSKLLTQFKKAYSEPTQAAHSTYSTGTKQHCGNDNFVISYWGKVETADGNIIRKAILIDRLGGEKHFVSGVSPKLYNDLCSLLTPAAMQYGIEYDSITGQWIQKTAASIMTFNATGEELDKILGQGKKSTDAKKDLAGIEEEAEPEEEDAKSIPFDEGQAGETSGLPEGDEPTGEDKALDDLLKGL